MKLNLTAIGLGIVSDLAISALGAICLSFAGITADSQELYMWSLILGLGAIVAGGCVTFIKSPGYAFANTLAFAVIEILIGGLLTVRSPMPAWFVIASAVLIIPATLAGGYLGKITTFDWSR
ncbi:MAG TPA: hypothetical protein VMT72_10335 [Pseudolabrys sp.]|nr:hypothetical protein [Pseudolabrys sp.]